LKLVVISHKPCWRSPSSSTGFASNGGFPFQVQALAELFDATTLALPCLDQHSHDGEIPLVGHQMSVCPLTAPSGSGPGRKLLFPFWFLRNLPRLILAIRNADAVHAPIPGDVGTIGFLLARLLGKPLFVRYCGNWLIQETAAERFWKWLMERCGGRRNVMLATGGADSPPSEVNPKMRWIFSTSLREVEMKALATPRQLPVDRPIRLVIVCRQEIRKGTGIVIQSMPLVIKEGVDVTLDVVGDGSALEKFKAMALELDLKDRITFHGTVDHKQVIEQLRRADLFTYPTTASEGFPKCVLEALACGLPVISTGVSVLSQLQRNGCGVLIDQATPEAVAVAIRKCVTDPKVYLTMTTQALDTARKFSLDQWRDTIGEWLESAWGPLQSHDRS